MFKLIIVSAALALVNGEQFLRDQRPTEDSSPSLGTQSSAVQLRGPGNLAEISSYSKTLETPYSSQSKSDVRLSNSNIYRHGIPVINTQGGFGRQNSATYPSSPSVSHVTYNSGPVAYATAPTLGQEVGTFGPSYGADHAIGSSHESTVKSLDGSRAVTHYSKAVDTAYSSVRKSDSRVTNDAKIVGAAPTLTYATAAYASPHVSKTAYAAHQVNPANVAYSLAPVVAHAAFAGLGTQYNW